MIEDMFPHAEIVAEAISSRRQLELAGFERYRLLDRGSYEVAPYSGELVLELCEIASQRLGRDRLTAFEARVVRLRAGDYVLARHDRVYEGRPVELVLDLSPVPVVDAEVHYRRRGRVFFRVPCVPRSLAIIERTPVVTCNHTYVSRRTPDASVTRLIVLVR